MINIKYCFKHLLTNSLYIITGFDLKFYFLKYEIPVCISEKVIEIVDKLSMQHCIKIYFTYCENDDLDVLRIIMAIIIRPNLLMLMNIFQS